MMAGLIFFANTSIALAKMDSLTYMTEMNALSKAVALEEKCNIAIDPDAMMAFVTEHFAGHESEVLSELNANVRIAKYSLRKSSALEINLLCATVQKYVNNHKLAPAN